MKPATYAALIALIPSIGLAATISIDTTSVIAGQPNQPITFSVTGGETVTAMNFYFQIGDGGTDLGGLDTAPLLAGSYDINSNYVIDPGVIALDSGSIWAGKNPTSFAINSYPLAYVGSVDIGGSTTLNGTIGTIYVDATGLGVNETFDIRVVNLLDDPGNSTQFTLASPASQIGVTGETSATITAIVPEPSTLALLFSLGGLTLLRRPRACN